MKKHSYGHPKHQSGYVANCQSHSTWVSPTLARRNRRDHAPPRAPERSALPCRPSFVFFASEGRPFSRKVPVETGSTIKHSFGDFAENLCRFNRGSLASARAPQQGIIRGLSSAASSPPAEMFLADRWRWGLRGSMALPKELGITRHVTSSGIAPIGVGDAGPSCSAVRRLTNGVAGQSSASQGQPQQGDGDRPRRLEISGVLTLRARSVAIGLTPWSRSIAHVLRSTYIKLHNVSTQMSPLHLVPWANVQN